MSNFKNISIGKMISSRVKELDVDISRICFFLKCSEKEIKKMYEAKSLDTDILLKWCKLLEYDFFRIYTQHLILYSPISSSGKEMEKSSLPIFRKNIYTREIIDFILEEVFCGNITKQEVIDKYKIPKTTLYKWIKKYEKI